MAPLPRASSMRREKPPQPDVRIKRERDAGEIDQPRLHQAFRHGAPLRQLEQLARRRRLAPIMHAPFAFAVGVGQSQRRKPARRAQDQIGGDAFGGGQRQNRVGKRIVAQRGREGDRHAGARQIDRGVEGVAGARQREAAVGAARKLDDRLADADRAFAGFGHALPRRVYHGQVVSVTGSASFGRVRAHRPAVPGDADLPIVGGAGAAQDDALQRRQRRCVVPPFPVEIGVGRRLHAGAGRLDAVFLQDEPGRRRAPVLLPARLLDRMGPGQSERDSAETDGGAGGQQAKLHLYSAGFAASTRRARRAFQN